LLGLNAGGASGADQVVTSNGNSGANTLRQAIADVGEGETITFNIFGSDTVTIDSQLSIDKGLTINGTNAATGNPVTVQVTIPGWSDWRVFNIDAADKTITISHMSVKGGDGVFSFDGGGIYLAAGTLNLDSVTVSGSWAVWRGDIFRTHPLLPPGLNYQYGALNKGGAFKPLNIGSRERL